MYENFYFIGVHFFLFSSSFFGLRGRSPSLPRDFTVYTVTLPLLRVFHCERCRIRTRDHCLSSLEHYQWATTSVLYCVTVCVGLHPCCHPVPRGAVHQEGSHQRGVCHEQGEHIRIFLLCHCVFIYRLAYGLQTLWVHTCKYCTLGSCLLFC